MSLRCKKGDLAIVVIGDEAGAIVKVMDFVGDIIFDGCLVRDVWHIKFRGRTHNDLGNRWACQDRQLRPIRPGDLKETEETEREVESVVS